jgi:hypothetical protein
MDTETRDRRPAQDIPVQEPREGIGERRERRPAAEQPRALTPTPPARGPTRDNNQRANEGANIDANADADAPLFFRRASQNLATAAMLLRGCPEAVTSEERRVRQQLKVMLEVAAVQQAESSASHQHSEHERAGASSAHGPNLPPSQHRGRKEGSRAVASVVRSRLEPNRDIRNTIEACRWAKSVDNHRDARSRNHNDRGHGRRHDRGDDRDRS